MRGHSRGGGGSRLRNEHARFRAWRACVCPARSPAAGFALGALVASHQDPQPAIPILVLRPTRTPELRTAASHRPAWWQRGEGRQVPLAWTTGPGPWGWVPLRVGGPPLLGPRHLQASPRGRPPGHCPRPGELGLSVASSEGPLPAAGPPPSRACPPCLHLCALVLSLPGCMESPPPQAPAGRRARRGSAGLAEGQWGWAGGQWG